MNNMLKMSSAQSFLFLDRPYIFSRLMKAETIKVYWESDKSERKLIRDEYGRLLHYSYKEEMRFDGRPDRIDFLWVAVENEQDSDNLTSCSHLSLLRIPCIIADETGWIGVMD
jgi:hypothetical protein